MVQKYVIEIFHSDNVVSRKLMEFVARIARSISSIAVIKLNKIKTSADLANFKRNCPYDLPVVKFENKLYYKERLNEPFNFCLNYMKKSSVPMSNDELLELHMQAAVSDKGDDDDDGRDDVLDKREIDRRMKEFASRRSVREKVTADKSKSSHIKREYKNDDQFVTDSGVDLEDNVEDIDGADILESWMNEEADMAGRKKSNKPIRKAR